LAKLSCLFFLFFFTHLVASDSPNQKSISLTDGQLELEVSLASGGRLVSFNLIGKKNVLALGKDYRAQQAAEISASAPHADFLGHISWVAPQSQWWQFQNLNEERLQLKAVWPPDPYIAYAPTRVSNVSDTSLSIEGQKSPISGVQMDKQFILRDQRLVLTSRLINVSDRPLPWTPWFVTRVPGQATIYVPAANDAVTKYSGFDPQLFEAIDYQISEGLFALRKQPPKPALLGQQGKWHLHPSSNWMASFYAGQVLLIRFEMLEKGQVHPDHALVEVFYKHLHAGPDKTLIEIESHSAAGVLQPSASVSAQQVWSLHVYTGENTPAKHREFLEGLLGSDF
jgi:hypothetical protein